MPSRLHLALASASVAPAPHKPPRPLDPAAPRARAQRRFHSCGSSESYCRATGSNLGIPTGRIAQRGLGGAAKHCVEPLCLIFDLFDLYGGAGKWESFKQRRASHFQLVSQVIPVLQAMYRDSQSKTLHGAVNRLLPPVPQAACPPRAHRTRWRLACDGSVDASHRHQRLHGSEA